MSDAGIPDNAKKPPVKNSPQTSAKNSSQTTAKNTLQSSAKSTPRTSKDYSADEKEEKILLKTNAQDDKVKNKFATLKRLSDEVPTENAGQRKKAKRSSGDEPPEKKRTSQDDPNKKLSYKSKLSTSSDGKGGEVHGEKHVKFSLESDTSDDGPVAKTVYNFSSKDPSSPIPTENYGYFSLFRYSNHLDRASLVIGIICAIAGGLCLPAMVRLFGRLTNKMVILQLVTQETALVSQNFGHVQHLLCYQPTGNFTQIVDKNLYDNPKQVIRDEISSFALWHTIFAVGYTLLSAVHFVCWYFPAEYMTRRLRSAYFRALLNKEISWFEDNEDVDFVNNILENTQRIRSGIGEHISMAINLVSIFIFSLINAFIHGWKLTLVAMISIPLLIVVSSMVAVADANRVLKSKEAFSAAGSLAEEVFISIRTVMVYNAQRHELHRFKTHLVLASKGLTKSCCVTAIYNGLVWLSTYSNYALTFWYGTKLVLEDRTCSDKPKSWNKYDAGNLVVVFFSVMFGAINIGLTVPIWESMNIAKGCGKEILEIIDSKSELENLTDEGVKRPGKPSGKFTFHNVQFSYPSRKNVKVVSDFTIVIEPGMTVALVGESGCGKSTILKLLLKYYLPDSGHIQLDGYDLKNLNVGYLRSHIAVVSQTPYLFNMTIEENVRLGRLDATFQEIKEACIAADAHSFIIELRHGYQTVVTPNRLSGGQKQKIALARALVRDTKILILDEVTSALDPDSESQVQIALQSAVKGRTTFIVAHRLNTIASADLILVMDKGKIAEQGTCTELLEKRGIFYNMASKGDQQQQPIGAIEKKRRVSMTNLREAGRNVVDQLRNEEFYLSKVGSRRRSSVMAYSPHNSIHTADPVINKLAKAFMAEHQKRRSSVMEAPLYPEHPPDTDSMQTDTPPHPPPLTQEKSVDSLDQDWNEMKKRGSGQVDIPEDTPEKDEKKVGILSAIWLATGSCLLIILIGVLGSILVGATLPVYGFLFGEVIGALSWHDVDEAVHWSLRLTIAFIVVGLLAALATFVQNFALNIATIRTVRKVQKLLFASILRQEMSWFEIPENSVACLSTRLNADAGNLEFVIQSVYGTFFQCATTIVVSVTYAFFIAPTLTAYTVALVPLVIFMTLLDALLSKVHEDKKEVQFEQLSNLVMEVFQNKQTVTAFQLEYYFMDKFDEALKIPLRSMKCLTFFRCIAFGLAQAGAFWAYSICMFVGGQLMDSEGLKYEDVIKVGEALIFALITIGPQIAVFSSFFQAVSAAKLLLKIINRVPRITYDAGGEDLLACINGRISFKNVDFAFPHDPKSTILKGITLDIDKGQMVALVGPSGSGKSCLIQLIMRFHDPRSGVIEVSDRALKTLNCSTVRRHMALVEQEPRLFDRTIYENIVYGSDSAKENEKKEIVDMNSVIAAARKASIHKFIASLPEGYETRVGQGGGHLSGGQRQRIAIARALYRDPQFLLLDEATSALDAESEKQVLKSLEIARAGRTCVGIYHRLDSVKTADKIFVLKDGVIVEQGQHDQLIALNGLYTQLYNKSHTITK